MTTKTTTIRLIDVSPDLLHKRDSGAPIGWVQSVMAQILGRIPAQERDSAVIFGLHDCVVRYEHALTEVEELREQLAAERAKIAALKAPVPASGEGTVTLTYDEIRAL